MLYQISDMATFEISAKQNPERLTTIKLHRFIGPHKI